MSYICSFAALLFVESSHGSILLAESKIGVKTDAQNAAAGPFRS